MCFLAECQFHNYSEITKDSGRQVTFCLLIQRRIMAFASRGANINHPISLRGEIGRKITLTLLYRSLSCPSRLESIYQSYLPRV